MNRNYSKAQYLSLLKKIRTAVPDIAVTTDILVGFPGETENDFHELISLMEEAQFDDAFMYKYNPREGTKAYDLPDTVPDELKIERLQKVITLQKRIGIQQKRLRIGNIEAVLVQSISKKHSDELLAKTERDEMVVFPGPQNLIGSFAFVELSGLQGNTFIGKEIRCSGT